MTPEQANALMAPLSGEELQSLAAEVGRADRKSVAKAIGIGRGTLMWVLAGSDTQRGETNMKIRVWLASRTEPCGAKHPDGYECSRRKGHEGAHEQSDQEAGMIERWEAAR